MGIETSFAVDARELTRIYSGRAGHADVVALDAVTLRVRVGEVHGLLGPNGAGKTTLVKILSTVLLPTSGSATILGHDVVRETVAVRRLIGTVFGGERGLYTELTGRENLEHWAALYELPRKEGRRRAAELLERVGLASRGDDMVEGYSRGMKQRLHLARGLINDSRVLFLDEPTIGMDPVAARDFRALVKHLRGEGRTILLTTHDMAEAEAVCDRVAMINHGRIIAVETPRTLSKRLARFERIDFDGAPDHVVAQIRAIPGVSSVYPQADGDGFRVEVMEGSVIGDVLRTLVEAGVTSLRTSMPSLEDVYFQLLEDRERSSRLE